MPYQMYQINPFLNMRDYVPGEDLTGVEVLPNDSPAAGGKIAITIDGKRYFSQEVFENCFSQYY